MLRSLNLTVLLSLLGVVVGWVLNEASSVLRTRRDQKKTYGRALLRLLQLREIFDGEIGRIQLAKELRRNGRFNEHPRKMLIEEREKDLADFSDGNDEALSEVSTADPVLSYELNFHVRRMRNVMMLAGSYAYPQESDEWDKFWEEALLGGEEVGLKVLIVDTENLMMKLARRIGFLSLWKIKAHLKQAKQLRIDYPRSRLADYIMQLENISEDIKQRVKEGTI